MIIQVLFLFASCINFKDFHFETSSVYYKNLRYLCNISTKFWATLFYNVDAESAYSGFGCFCLFSALQSQDEELIFFSSEKFLRQQEKKMANTSALQNEKRNHLIKFIFHPSVLCSYPLNSLIRLRALLT